MSRLRITFMTAIVFGLAALLGACGGDDEAATADQDPQEILERAFGPEGEIESAAFEGSIDAEMKGPDAESFQIDFNGAGQETEAEMPDFDVEVRIRGGEEDSDFTAGMTLTSDAGYITLDGETYEIESSLLGQVRQEAGSAAGEGENGDSEDGEAQGLLGDLEVSEYATDLTNEGTVDVEGTETVHVSGSIDSSQLLGELEQVISGASSLEGAGVQVPGSEELGELEQALTDVSFDAYAGADDGLLRRLEVDAPVSGGDGEGSGSVRFSVTLTEVNEPQTIEEPENAKPFGELIAAIGGGALSELGIEDLGDLTELGDAGGFGGLGGAGQGPGAGDGGGAGNVPEGLGEALEDGPGVDQTRAALECIQSATSAAEIAECEELVR